MDLSGLSDIEMQIAMRLSDGYSHAEIAACVGLSTSAVKQRITTIMRKTGAPNKIVLAVEVLRERLGK